MRFARATGDAVSSAMIGAALAACDGSSDAIVGDHDAGGELCCLNASASCAPATPCNGEIGGQPVGFSCDDLYGSLIDCRDPACQVLGQVCINFENNLTCTGTIGACPASCAWPANGSPFTCPEPR